MTVYKTYQEAKIANPESDIYLNYLDSSYSLDWRALENIKCNPADHCMTVERFLANGNKFVEGEGDSYIDSIGIVRVIGDEGYSKYACSDVRNINKAKNAFILHAAALEEKKPRTKVEYVKCGFNSRGAALDCFDNNEELYEPSCNPEGYSLCEDPCNVIDMWDQLYRRIETQMTEREEFIEKAVKCYREGELPHTFVGRLFDSGKFKLVN